MLLSALLLSDHRAWRVLVPVAVMVTGASCLVHGQAVNVAAALSLVPAIEAVLAVMLIRRLLGDSFAFDRIPHACAFFVGAIAAATAGSIAATPMLGAAGVDTLAVDTRGWWLREVLGMLVVGPLVLGLVAERATVRTVRGWRIAEAATVFGGISAVTALIFGEIIDPFLSVPTYVLPFLLWGAFRFGPTGGATTVFIVMVVAMWNAARGNGPLAEGISTANLVLRSQGAMIVATISFLLLATIVAERRRIAEENTRLVAQLQQALAEVKTLQGFIPICAWCHKVRDDAGFWQQIEMYLDARTDATFSHSICPSCERRAHDEVATHHEPDTARLI